MASIRQVCVFYSAQGGVERAVSSLVGLLKDKHQVDVLCTKHGSGVQTNTIDGVNITQAGSHFDLCGRPLSLSFLHLLQASSSDIIHYHLPCPLAAIGHIIKHPQVKVAVATWHHDLQHYRLLNNVHTMLLDLLFKDLNAIIVTSPALIETIPVLSRHRQKCRVIPLGADETCFYPAKGGDREVARWQQKYGKSLVLFVGRLVYYKGLDVLIKAMPAVDAGLVIAGTGPLEARLKHLAEELGVGHKVHFLGHVPDSALPGLYRASSVLVLPSTERTECFGLVQVEAMLSAVPVINTWLPTGVPWVSQDQITGLTVMPGDEKALAHALRQILSSQDLRIRLGQAGRKRALENFTWSRHVAAVNKLYAELLAGK